MKLKKDDVILFQGDSITDAERKRPLANPPKSRNNFGHLSGGYAGMASAMLDSKNLGLGLTFHNRGVSGNRITDLMDRWEADCYVLKPNLISILIGINDTWHGVAKGTPENGVGVQDFDRHYRDLIESTKKTLPGVGLVICEPFTTEAGAVLEMNFHPDIDERREVVKSIANDMADVYVPFQDLFDDLCKSAPATCWARDGVHPTPAGHLKMAEFWVECVLK